MGSKTKHPIELCENGHIVIFRDNIIITYFLLRLYILTFPNNTNRKFQKLFPDPGNLFCCRSWNLRGKELKRVET